MTALILRAMPLVVIVVPKLRSIYQGFLHAFAEATMRNAVPNWPREARRRDQSLSPADATPITKMRVKTLTPDVDLPLIPMGRGGMARGARVSGQSNCLPNGGRAPRTE